MKKLVFCLLLTLSPSLFALGPHTHGVVGLDFAWEGKELIIMLKSPADSFLGYEHRPKNKKQKSTYHRVKSDWSKRNSEFFNIPSFCKLKEHKWAQVFQKESKSHSEIEAELLFNCEKSLKGSQLTVTLKKHYKKIEKINIQLMREDGSVLSKTFKDDSFSLDL